MKEFFEICESYMQEGGSRAFSVKVNMMLSNVTF